MVGLVDEVTGAAVLVEDLKEREVSACGVVVALVPVQEMHLAVAAMVAARTLVVAIALVVAIPGADVDGDPHNADVDVVVVLAVDVDVVVAPETEVVGPAVAGDPDRHSIVEVHNVYTPGIIVEGCASSGGCAAAAV